MWLSDIVRILSSMKDSGKYKDLVIERMFPAQDGIIMHTSHHTIIYAHNDGRVEEIVR